MAKILGKSIVGSPDVSYADQPTVAVPYTTITNRKRIQDLSKDMAPKFGVERIPVQSLYQLQDEFGPNGEPVWSALNDDKGLIRLVGSFGAADAANGPGVRSTTSGNFIEIVFYGTGLNMLVGFPSSGADVRVTVDGGSEGATNVHPTGHAAILNGRYYAPNGVVAVVSGLALGVHTIKLRHNSSITWDVHGFEVITQTSQLAVLPGSLIQKGSRIANSSTQLLDYKPAALTGTRGGRVVVYSSGGSIQTAVQAVDSSAAYLTSASHANEEIARTYQFREFGAARTADDDFSRFTATSNRAFTLEDGTTTLIGSGVSVNQTNPYPEGLYLSSPGSFFTLTFVGTGLDLVQYDTGNGTDTTFTLSVDGNSVPSYVTGSTLRRNVKIVSGLPYGTHTVKLTRNAGASLAPTISSFIVYQPKKPSIPTGAVELADYNVAANYSFTAANGATALSGTGTIYKDASREFVYTGTWGSLSVGSEIYSGSSTTTTIGADVSLTFFGTGVILSGTYGSSASVVVEIDGLTYTGSATVGSAPLSSGTWTPGTGTWTLTGTQGSKLSITGLSLGVHKVKVIVTSQSGGYIHRGWEVITPIHSSKSNLYADLQNTLPVGSCSLSDNRILNSKLKPQKAWAQATGATLNPTTTSQVPVPMPDMSVAIKTDGGLLDVSYSATVSNSTQGTVVYSTVFLNGAAVGTFKTVITPQNNYQLVTSDRMIIPVSSGTHKIDVYWHTNSSTLTATDKYRTLTVREL